MTDPLKGVASASQRIANETYFKKFHDDVLKNGQQLEEDGWTTTMRIAGVQLDDGKEYLIPLYNPKTKTVEDVEAAVKRAIPDIKAGRLHGYSSPDEAEEHRLKFYKRIIGEAQ